MGKPVLRQVKSKDTGLAKLFTVDGLMNLITGMGTRSDKSHYSRYVRGPSLDDDTLGVIYRNDWIAAKAIDIPAQDMVREWRYFEELDESDQKEITTEEKRLMYQTKLQQAIKWSRLFGGSVIFLNVADGLPTTDPLDVRAIKPGTLKWLTVIDKSRISSYGEIDYDPTSSNYGQPTFYQLNSLTVHHTRVVRFDGIELPHDQFLENDMWGDSIVKRIYQSLINCNTVYDSIASMIHESNVDVIKIPGLMNMVGDCESEKNLITRLRNVQLFKSIHNMTVLDDLETYDKKSNSFAGLKDMIYDYLVAVSGAVDIPVTRMIGVSPGGMNATGESDLRNYYDRISSDQESKLRCKMEYIDSVMMMSIGKPEFIDAEWDYNPLWQMTEKEKAETENFRADRDNKYASMVPETSILRKIQSEGTYQIDDAFIEAMEESYTTPPDDEDAAPPASVPTTTETPPGAVPEAT